jgi:hypothetical protein
MTPTLECAMGRLAGIAVPRGNQGDYLTIVPWPMARIGQNSNAQKWSNARDFKGLVFPLKAGNKPSEVD